MSHRLLLPLRRVALVLTLLALATPVLADSPAARADNGDENARVSFQRFAKSWMDKFKELEAEKRNSAAVKAGNASYRGYDGDFSIELRPTGHTAAPYIGLLRYTELVYHCAGEDCSVSSQVPVTEIFRYQNGRWIY